MRASSWNQISMGLPGGRSTKWAFSVAEKFFELRHDALILSRMARAGADVRKADPVQDLAHGALVVDDTEALSDEVLQVDPARQRTTPCTARSGPVSTRRASSVSCSAQRRDGLPLDRMSFSPSGPCWLKRWTQSLRVWRSMPPMRAASVRFIPSRTAARDNRRRLWLAFFVMAASRRSSLAAKSVRLSRLLAWRRSSPHH